MNVQTILDLLKTIPFDQLKSELIPAIIAIGDKLVAGNASFFVGLAWKLIRAWLVTEEGATAAHAAMQK